MRIQGQNGIPGGDRDKATSSVTPAAGTTPASTPPVEAARAATQLAHSDVVLVSPAASELSAQASRGQAVQAERVARIKSAVDAGTYKPDLDQLAQKFVDEEIVGPQR